MSETVFFWLTLVGGTLFAYALLWVIAQWLKADEEAEAVERQVQERLEGLAAAGCTNPSPGCCPEFEGAA